MADRYWVGGTGNWDASSTTHWSATSGGSGGASVPTSADNVIFDTNSNPSGYTVTITAAANCLNLTVGNPAAGNLTLAGSSGLSVYGNYNMANITLTHSGTVTFRATSTGKTITTNGETITHSWTFDGVGGGWTLQDNVTATGRTWTLTNGSLDINGKTVSLATILSSNSNTRTLTLGAATINFSGTWNLSTTTNLTFSGASATIAGTGTGTKSFAGGGLTYNVVTFTTGGTVIFSGANTFGTLTLGDAASVNNAEYQFPSGVTTTITGTLTLASTTFRGLVKSTNLGSAATISAAVVSITRMDFMDITCTGAGTWSGTTVGDCQGNTGLTPTTPTTRYWVGGSGNWSNTSHWSASSGGAGGASLPLPQDNVVWDANSGGGIVEDGSYTRLGKNATFVGFTGTFDLHFNTWNLYGSLTLDAGMTWTQSEIIAFRGRGSQTITTAGKTMFWLSFYAPGGTYTLQDDLTGSGNRLTFDAGTFDANDFDVTSTVYTLNANATINMGSGTWLITATSTSPVWDNNGATINAETSLLKMTGALVNAVAFNGGNATYNNFWNATTGAFAVTIADSNTFADFKIDAGRTQKFTAGTTTTVQTFTAVGTPGNLITIDSNNTSTHALVKSTPGDISCDYMDIQHSVATPGATWYAGLNSVNDQGVATPGSGWIFTEPTDASQGFFALMGAGA